jgi:hypothetical protein
MELTGLVTTAGRFGNAPTECRGDGILGAEFDLPGV